MKKAVILIFFLSLFISCEKPSDCLKSSGVITSKVYEGLSFNKIIVHKGIALVITQGDNYKVEVKTGQNLINDIEVKVLDGLLSLEDNTTCNWVREYGETVVYVTTPTLTDVYCKTEKNITSNGVLTFPKLHLVSQDKLDGYTGAGTGDYILQLDTENLWIENNDVSRYFISGRVSTLAISFYEFGGIFHGENLQANNVSIYHRGYNDIFVNPIQSISGDIYNTGNIICTTRPPSVQVVEHYRGRLIFN